MKFFILLEDTVHFITGAIERGISPANIGSPSSEQAALPRYNFIGSVFRLQFLLQKNQS